MWVVAIWGALDVNSADAAREVLEHAFVATGAEVWRRFGKSREQLGLALFQAEMEGDPADPEAPLVRMTQLERLLRDERAEPLWFGPGAFVCPITAPSRSAAAEIAGQVAAALAAQGDPVACGVAHGSEVGDAGDLLRLAEYRAVRNLPPTGQPPMTQLELLLSPGEWTRLELISSNRSRATDALLREAIDLVVLRHA
jgi:hypothetical protein